MKDAQVNNTTLSQSMQQTIEFSNLDFVDDIGELMLDATLDDGILKEIPVLSIIVGVSKCIRNVYDFHFAKKLIAFLIPIKDVPVEEREAAIKKWEQDENYRGKVGDTLLGMIERCDDTVKAVWLSKHFHELVLKRNKPRLFMRAEKVLSSLSIMDMQAILNMSKDQFSHLKENECEPYIGSGLFQNPQLTSFEDGAVDFGKRECLPTEIGYVIFHILKGIPMTDY